MINLLPTEYADSIRYGRRNAALRKWLFGAALAIAGLLLILSGGWLYLDQQAKNLQKSIGSTDQQLKAQNQAQVQKDAKEITGDISVINKVLSQEIRFSDLIQAIGQEMPSGAVLSSLSLTNNVTGGIDLSVSANDYPAIAQTAASLGSDSSQLFSKVDVIGANCTSGPIVNQAYKCNATLRALFSKQAQTKFLSVPKSGSKS